MTAGLYFSANDAVLPWAKAFLNSFRAFNPDLPAYLVPFDDRCEQVLALCDRHGVGAYEDPTAFARLEAIGRNLELGRTPHGPRWFRRYACLLDAAPLDRFAYLDARTLVLAGLREFINAPDRYGVDLAFTDAEVAQVYESGPVRTGFLRVGRGRGFNSGRWASRRGLFSLDELEEHGRACVAVRDQLNPRNTDQAFFNFCCDAGGERCANVGDLLPDTAAAAWAGSPGRVYRDAAGVYRRWDHRGRCGGGPDHGKRVPVLHWAGLPLSAGTPEAQLLHHFRTLRATPARRAAGRGGLFVRGLAAKITDRTRGARLANAAWHAVATPRDRGPSALRPRAKLRSPDAPPAPDP